MKRNLVFLLVAMLILSVIPVTAVAEEPVVLKVGSVRALGDNWLDHPVIQDICTELNITIDYTQYDDDAFSLMLAGGGLADIVVGEAKYVPAILNNKIALNIFPLLDEYAPNVKADAYMESIKLMQTMFGQTEDELYLLAPNTGVEFAGGNPHPARGYSVRWDYYKELGCPEITCDADYLEVLKQMQANHPQTADGSPTYAFGVERSIGDMGGYRASFVAENFTNPWTFSAYKFKSDLVTGELYDGYMDPEHSSYWTDMNFYNKIYREGLFDIDSFTMPYDEYDAKVANGAYMGLYFSSDSLYRETSKQDPETTAGFVVVPSKGAISFANKLSLLGNFPSGYTFIPAESENWEKALAFINKLYDMNVMRDLYCGKKGEYWDYDENGVPYLFEETFEKKTSGQMDWGLSDLNMLIPYSATTVCEDGKFIDLFSEDAYLERGLTSVEKDFCEYYGMRYPGDLQQQMADSGETIDMSNDRGQTIYACISDIPMDIRRILDNCNDILDRAMPELIMSETDEEFAEVQADVMEQLKNAEESVAWEWATERWTYAKGLVDPIWLEAKGE